MQRTEDRPERRLCFDGPVDGCPARRKGRKMEAKKSWWRVAETCGKLRIGMIFGPRRLPTGMRGIRDHSRLLTATLGCSRLLTFLDFAPTCVQAERIGASKFAWTCSTATQQPFHQATSRTRSRLRCSSIPFNPRRCQASDFPGGRQRRRRMSPLASSKMTKSSPGRICCRSRTPRGITTWPLLEIVVVIEVRWSYPCCCQSRLRVQAILTSKRLQQAKTVQAGMCGRKAER